MSHDRPGPEISFIKEIDAVQELFIVNTCIKKWQTFHDYRVCISIKLDDALRMEYLWQVQSYMHHDRTRDLLFRRSATKPFFSPSSLEYKGP